MDQGDFNIKDLTRAIGELTKRCRDLRATMNQMNGKRVVPEGPFDFIGLPLLVRLSVYQIIAFSDLQALRLVNSTTQGDIDDYIGLIPTLTLSPLIPSNILEYIRDSYFQNILVKGDCRLDPKLPDSGELLYTPGSVKSLEFSVGCATSLPLASYLLNSCCNLVELNFSGMIEGGFFTDAKTPIEKFQFNNLRRLKIDARGGAWSPSNIGNCGKWFTSQISLLEMIECPGVKDVSLSLFTYRVEPNSLQILTKAVFNFTRELIFLKNIQISLRQKEGLVRNEEIPTAPAQDPENPSEDLSSLSPLLLLNQGKLKNFTLVSTPEGNLNISSMKLAYLTEEDPKFCKFVPIIPPPEGSSYLRQVSRNLVSLSITLSNSQFNLGDFGHLDNLKHIKIFNSGNGNAVASPLLNQLDHFHTAMENKLETMIFKDFQIPTQDFSIIANRYKKLKYFANTGRYNFNYAVETGMKLDCLKTLVNSRALEGLLLPISVIRMGTGDRVRLAEDFNRWILQCLDDADMDILNIAGEGNQHWWIPRRERRDEETSIPVVFYHT